MAHPPAPGAPGPRLATDSEICMISSRSSSRSSNSSIITRSSGGGSSSSSSIIVTYVYIYIYIYVFFSGGVKPAQILIPVRSSPGPGIPTSSTPNQQPALTMPQVGEGATSGEGVYIHIHIYIYICIYTVYCIVYYHCSL